MSTKPARSSYPRWSGASQRPTPFIPKTDEGITPLSPPPSSTCSNPLPSRKPIPSPQGWASSRHIIPAAYPRTLAESTGTLERSSSPYTAAPGAAGPGESSDERKKRNLGEAKACVRARLDATPTLGNEGSNLWLAGERWTRKEGDSGSGLTLVVSAANGFTKESWMPTIKRLIDSQRRPSHSQVNNFGTVDLPKVLATTRINEVWFLDDYHHGQSMDLNKGLIGPVHSWLDGGRDIVNFIKHVIPPPGQDASETLNWRGEKSSSVNRDRKVIGLGHSVGGNAMVRAAHLAPELFHALFLVEPMTPPIHATHAQLESKDWSSIFWRPVITLRRRTTWSNMVEALRVRSSPFFSSWHDEVFKIWETHHLVPSDSTDSTEGRGGGGGGGVTLATPSWAEAAVFSETTGLGEGWDALPGLEVPCAFLMAGDAGATLGEELTREMVWRPSLAVNERIMDAGHLIVHEKPDEVADAISRFLSTIEIDANKQKAERAKL